MDITTIDLRSDTVTIPSREMLETVLQAELGDSLRGEDPTVNALQGMSSRIFQKEGALLLISGTMANQVAIYAWSGGGSVVLAPEDSHIARKEALSTAVISGCSVYPVKCERGIMDPEAVRVLLTHQQTLLGGSVGLVTIENTVNAPGGVVYPLELMEALHNVCREFKVPLHVDGSRIFNALIAGGTAPEDGGRYCDSLTFCLSKGLGAPLGSVLLGSEAFIDRAKEARNLIGGGMRQAGIMAACGMYALTHNVKRLMVDHDNAKMFAAKLEETGLFMLLNVPVETNMVIFRLQDRSKTGAFETLLREKGVLIDFRRAPVLRAVTNLNHSQEEVERAGEILGSTANF